MLLFLAIFGLYISRLVWLQFVQGRSLAATAVKYHSRTVYYRWGHGSEGRGAILDCQLRPLTEGQLRPGLAVFASVGRNEREYEDWMEFVAVHTAKDRDEIVRLSQQGRPLRLERPLPTGIELPHWIVPIEAEWNDRGELQRDSQGLARHVLGSVEKTYQGVVGRLGVEQAFNQLLRCGRPGVSAFTDAEDRLIPGLGYRDPARPEHLPNVVLTLDIEIQRMVEELFDAYIESARVPRQGALVVMNPTNGHILALCSRPLPQEGENEYNRGTRKSADVNMLPLASLVKVATAAAALEKDPGFLDARFVCSGRLTLGANNFECRHGPHGEQDLTEAMANSCNLYFAQLAQQVGGEELLAMAMAMGLGQKPSLGLPAVEVWGGSLPALEDLATAAGLANNFAMGGNKLEATPLQAAVMLSAIANGGWKVAPRLVVGVNQDLNKEVVVPPVNRERIISRSTAQTVAALLRNVVIQGKTGRFDPSRYPYAAAEMAFKTGTSDPLPPENYSISWCGGFFPWRSPAYVVVYMAEVPPGAPSVDRGSLVAEIAQKLAAWESANK